MSTQTTDNSSAKMVAAQASSTDPAGLATVSNGPVEASRSHRHHGHHTGPFVHIAHALHDVNHRRNEKRRQKRRQRYADLGVHYDEETSTEEVTGALEAAAGSSDAHRNRVVVDTLEVIDPKVGTLATLDDITRSIVIPSTFAGRPRTQTLVVDDLDLDRTSLDTSSSYSEQQQDTPQADGATSSQAQGKAKRKRKPTKLDRRIEHLLEKQHDLYQKLLPILAGVWAFLKTPLGVIVGIYGFLIVFTGAALVICLAGWVPGNKDLQVEVFSQIINGLFTVMGVGFIPWRLRDTWHIARICHYRNRSNELRVKRGLAPLADPQDLAFEAGDVRMASLRVNADKATPQEELPDHTSVDDEKLARTVSILPSVEHEDEHMLSPLQSARLRDAQRKFAASCTWYRPTETATHRAFPIGYAVSIAALTDGNSLFQCLLDAYMWAYATRYRQRPAWSTGIFMPCSFLCGIGAGLLIWLGNKHTRKTEAIKAVVQEAYEAQATTSIDTSMTAKEDMASGHSDVEGEKQPSA